MKKEYWIHVKHVDNRLVIFLNGETVWDSGIIHNDPELNKLINITENLQMHASHMNELIFEGFNDSYTKGEIDGTLNPWHFHYKVFVRTIDNEGKTLQEEDMLAPYNQKHLSNPNIRAIDNRYQIHRENDEFKVVSNSLSQYFYN